MLAYSVTQQRWRACGTMRQLHATFTQHCKDSLLRCMSHQIRCVCRPELHATEHEAALPSTASAAPALADANTAVQPTLPVPAPSRRTTRRTAVNADLSPYQAKLQETLGLKSFGSASCWGDGNCGFNAVSQLLYGQNHAIDGILDLPPASQQQQSALRQAAADMLRSNSVLQAILSQADVEKEILQTWPAVAAALRARPAIPVWELFAEKAMPRTGTVHILCLLQACAPWHLTHSTHVCYLP